MVPNREFTLAGYQKDLRIRELEIELVFSTEEVLRRHPDLNHKQAWQLLLKIEEEHNRNYGVTWQAIDGLAQEVFGDSPDNSQG